MTRSTNAGTKKSSTKITPRKKYRGVRSSMVRFKGIPTNRTGEEKGEQEKEGKKAQKVRSDRTKTRNKKVIRETRTDNRRKRKSEWVAGGGRVALSKTQCRNSHSLVQGEYSKEQ